MIQMRGGLPGLFPSPEDAENHPYTPAERDFVDAWNAQTIHGAPDAVRAGLDERHKRSGADELMITTYAHSGEVRLRSHELVADAYGFPS